MSSILRKLKSNTNGASSANPQGPSLNTKTLSPETAIPNVLMHLREEESSTGNYGDKTFGMHNASNTCYCNSVIQCLYFSEPFRKQVIHFPSGPGSTSIAPIDETPTSDHETGFGEHMNTLQDPTIPSITQYATPNLVTTPLWSEVCSLSTKPEEAKGSFEYQKRQALVAGPNLQFSEESSEVCNMPDSLFTSLKEMFAGMSSHPSHTGVVHPIRFLDMLRREHETYRSPMHQDAHEFLNLLLNEVVDQVERYSSRIADYDSANRLLAGSRDDQEHSKVSSSWVQDIFEGTLTSETRCLTCETISQRDESFLDLSVDLEEHSSVSSCLRKFSEEEMLCEQNKFHCDSCSGLQEAEKRMKIKRLPKILALHLKRFKYIEDIGRLQKLFHRVVFPFHLRLLNTTDDAEDSDRLYELYGIIVHLGSTPFHGHYVAIIKTRHKGWLLFDDELVLPVNQEYVQNFFGGDARNPACAYVLFYQKITEEEVEREQQTDELNRNASFLHLNNQTSNILESQDCTIATKNRSRTTGKVDSLSIPKNKPTGTIEESRHGRDECITTFKSVNVLSSKTTSGEYTDLACPNERNTLSSEKDARELITLTKDAANTRFKNAGLHLRQKSRLFNLKDRELTMDEDSSDQVNPTGMAGNASIAQGSASGKQIRRDRSLIFSIGRKKYTK